MKRFLPLLLMAGSALAQTTTTYTGVIKDLTQQIVTSGQVTFTLALSTDSTIPGNGRFVPTTTLCNINTDGTLSGYVAGVVSGACNVTMNTALSPTGTSYKVCIQANYQTPGSCFFDYAITSTKDISTVVPTLQTGPINYGGVPGPTGPPGPGGVGCGAANCIVTSPAATQNIVQPAGTVFQLNNLTLTGPLTSNSTSLFSPTSNFTSSNFRVNGGVVADGVNLNTIFNLTNSFQNGVASLVGALQTRAGSTATEVDGVLGVAIQNGGSSFAVGLRGTGYCMVAGSCWGANFLASDSTTSPSTLWGFESDTNVFNASSIGQGGSITGFFAVQPTANMNALNIGAVSLAGHNYGWTAGIAFGPGAIAGSGTALFLAPVLGTASQRSQNITFESESSGGTLLFAHVFEDLNGSLQLCTSNLFAGCAGVNVLGDIATPHQLQSTVATGTAPLVVTSTTPVANLIAQNHPIAFAAGASVATPNTKIFSGTCTMAAGTCTISIPAGIFSIAPNCGTTAVNSGIGPGTTEPNVWASSISPTALVMDASSATYTGSAMAVCFGQ